MIICVRRFAFCRSKLRNLLSNPFSMKKYILVAAAGLLTTAAVTATVLHSGQKKAEVKKSIKHCPFQCSKSEKTACF
jgi:hypothetical protein